MVWLLWALACAGEPCENGDDCAEGEVCAWAGGSGTQEVCLTPCATDEDCGGAGRCTGQGASCPQCADVVSYCE